MEQSALCFKRESHTALLCAPVPWQGPGEEEWLHLHTYTNPSMHQCTQVQIPAAWEEKYIIQLCLIQCTLQSPGRFNFLEVKLNNWQRPGVSEKCEKTPETNLCSNGDVLGGACWFLAGNTLAIRKL